MVLGAARITEEGIDGLKRRKGSYSTVVYRNREISKDAIRHFVEGIGDPNPLWVNRNMRTKMRFR